MINKKNRSYNKKTVALLVILLSACWTPVSIANEKATDKTVHLTSLEWPPYSSELLQQQGAAIAIARAAFVSMGYKLNVSFFPWSRAVAFTEEEGSEYVGYFPEYYSAERAKTFIYSDPYASGPLGFAERKNKSIYWEELKELSSYRIGVVQDYINTAEFDEMVKNKTLNAPTTLNDTTNLRKLMTGRVDLAVVDKNVMNYLFKTNWSLKNKIDNVQFNHKILENKKLYICFKKTKEGQKMAEIFNKGLTKINAAAILEEYLSIK